MEIERLVVGRLQTNCYLASCPKTNETVIIDPGDDGDFIAQRIHDLGLKPKLILATHGHFDHVLAVMELNLAFKIPFLIHEDDLFLLKRLRKTAEYFLGYDAYPEGILEPLADRFLKDGDVITFGKEKLTVVETPGHTPGSICFRGLAGVSADSSTRPGKPFGFKGSQPEGLKNQRDGKIKFSAKIPILFSGDTLFCQGVGRTDFSYGSQEKLDKSIKKLLKLPKKTLVYPGHGPETNIASEKNSSFSTFA